jgi:tetratricopeptide (TPR) repeat protein
MGRVYLAQDMVLDRKLALKVMTERAGARRGGDAGDRRRRFLRESRICATLEHPGVIPIHDLVDVPGRAPYFTMKRVAGRTLSAILAGRADLAEGRTQLLYKFAQVCQTIAYAHSRGVIHRDLKSANVMIGPFGEVQVVDWGLAKFLDAQDDSAADLLADRSGEIAALAEPESDEDAVTQEGQVLGTLAYMPPEQARGEIHRLDRRSDVFGLGAILCEILAGRPPFAAAPPYILIEAVRRGDLSEAHRLLAASGADPELCALARRCLDPDQDRRPADAGVVVEAVSAHLEGVQDRLRRAEQAWAVAEARVEEQRKRRKLTAALVGATVLAALLAVSSWWFFEKQRRDRKAMTLISRSQQLSYAGRYLDALRAGHEAVRADPNSADAHFRLGVAAYALGDREYAGEGFRETLRLEEGHGMAHYNLGLVFFDDARYAEASAQFERAFELGVSRSTHELTLERARRLARAEVRLGKVLEGRAAPNDAVERLTFASLCAARSLYASAVKFYGEAFDESPAALKDFEEFYRYQAACAAVMAAAGKDKQHPDPPIDARASHLRLALRWLDAELSDLTASFGTSRGVFRGFLLGRLRNMHRDSRLSLLRDREALGAFPESIRTACGRFAADLASALDAADSSIEGSSTPPGDLSTSRER